MTGVKEVDEAFERIKAARQVARNELKALRQQYKKDTITKALELKWLWVRIIGCIHDDRYDRLLVVVCGHTLYGLHLSPAGRHAPPPLEEEAPELDAARRERHCRDDGHERYRHRSCRCGEYCCACTVNGAYSFVFVA